MNKTIETNYPLVRYRFTSEVLDPINLPFFSGSMLRGVFGHALRSVSCVTGRSSCDGCPVNTTCTYTRVFEPGKCAISQHYRQWPAPYVFEPIELGARQLHPGDRFAFDLVVFGAGLKHFSVVILALRKALGKGLMDSRGRLVLQQVERQDSKQVIWQQADNALLSHELSTRVAVPVEAGEIQLLLTTPTRLKARQKLLGITEVGAADVLSALNRRVHLFKSSLGLAEYSSTWLRDLTEHAKSLRIRTDLQWHKLQRYSNRQKQAMDMSGFTGSVHLSGDLAPHIEALCLGRWLHMGEKASFGLGAYHFAD